MQRFEKLGLGILGVGLLAFVSLSSAQAQEAPGLGGGSLLSPALLGQDPTADLSAFITETAFSGFIDVGYQYNFDANDTAAVAGVGGGIENGTRVFDTRQNEFQLHAIGLDLNKQTDADHLLGYHVTMMIGDDPSAVNAASPTAGEIFDGSDFVFTNGYIALQVPDGVPILEGAKIQLGRFETTIGAEVVANSAAFSGPGNANYSRSYLFGFSGPFTHTGVLLKNSLLPGDDTLHYHLGWTNGWDNIKDNNDTGTVLAGVGVDVDWFKLDFNTVWGPEQTQAFAAKANGDYRTLLELLVQVGLPANMADDMGLGALDGLSLIADLQWGGEEGVPDVAPGGGQGYAQWYGLAGIVRWDFPLPILGGDGSADNVYVAFRGEYFSDEDGSRGISRAIGVRDDVYALTWTFGWMPAEMFLLRVEGRLDKASYNAFHNGVRSHQFTLGANAVVSF